MDFYFRNVLLHLLFTTLEKQDFTVNDQHEHNI